MYASQSLYPCYVSFPYIGQDQAYNVFTRDFNSCLLSAEYLPHSLLDKDRWGLSLHGFSPICLVFHWLLLTPSIWSVFFHVSASISAYLSIYRSQSELGFVQVLFLLPVFLNERCSRGLMVLETVIKLFLQLYSTNGKKQTRNTSNLWEVQHTKEPGAHTLNLWAL